MNSFSQARIEVGLTRPEMLEMLGAKPGRLAIFSLPDDRIDPIFHEHKDRLLSAYRSWKSGMLKKLQLREEFGGGPLDMDEVIALTGLRSTAVVALRYRGTLHAELVGYEYFYPIAAVRALIELNSTILATSPTKTRAPLGAAFLRWYKNEIAKTVKRRLEELVAS